MKQVTNLLLVGSHKDRLTDGCRVQVYPACFNGVLTVWGGRSCARGPRLRRHSCMPSAVMAVMESPSAQWLVPYRSGPFAHGIA